uniref:Potassium channel tetramerization domain containing 13 n=1 Tax=Rousettus aegyptiacus TaxID=9407 RepID=A0A7J8EZE0_ROUAE|nr:potassium channel tetramerization domain containing 13 [Rousettus aegyptiacus]
MSAEASGPAAAEALSLEVSKPSGLEPGSAAYGLRPLTPNSKYVKLNVGGSLHYTTLRTLTGQDTMLKAMFSGRAEVLTDAGGWVLIDRSGRHFGTILNYLRDGSVPLPESTRELGELLGEARYYLVQGLIEDCQLALQQKRENLSLLCLIPTVTSPREEQQLLASTSKVEFPEARIFEETLNILIYETPRVPDPALLEATGGAAGSSRASRGEDEENREHRVRRIHVRRHITHDERPHGQQIVFKD